MDHELKSLLVPMVQSLQLSIRSLKDHHEQLVGLKRWRLALNQEMQEVNPNMQLAVEVRWREIAESQGRPFQDATLLALSETQRSLDSIAELLQR
jgi:hypothetical protein